MKTEDNVKKNLKYRQASDFSPNLGHQFKMLDPKTLMKKKEILGKKIGEKYA